MNSLMEDCSICNAPFDEFQHEPMLLCPKQHICCEYCLKQLLLQPSPKCPECRHFLKNWEVEKYRLYLDWLNERKQLRNKLKQQQANTDQFQQLFDAIGEIMAFNFPQKDKIYKYIKQRAEKLFIEGKNIAAIGLLEALIQKYPNQTIYPFIGLGSNQEQIGFSEGKPLRWYKKRYNINELSAEDLLNYILMETPTYVECQNWYHKMIQQHPQSYKLAYGLALHYHNEHQFQDALKQYRRVIELNPSFSKAYCMAAFIEENQEQSLRLGNICLSQDPANIFAKFIVASKSKQNNIQKLVQIYQSQTQFIRALEQVGNIYFERKQYEQAIRRYEICLEKNPLLFWPKINIGWAYVELGDQMKASEHAAKLLHESFDNQQRSDILRLKGSIAEGHSSIVHLKQAIEANPLNQQAYLDLAELYQQAEQHIFAAKIYQKMYVQNEKSINALKGVTKCYMKINKYTEAIDYYKKWMEIEPQAILIKQSLGIAYFKVKDWQNSLGYFLLCKNESYNLKTTYQKIIQCYQNLRDNKNALKYAVQQLHECQLSQEQYSKLIQKAYQINTVQKGNKQ